MSYNGWTNRETWLVNLYYNPETKSDLNSIKDQVEEAEENIENDFIKDFIDLSLINWEELEENLEDDEKDED